MMNAEESHERRLAIARPILPDHPPTFRYLDPAAALAFRTPLQEYPPSADTKASATLTALGIMFPLLAKFEKPLTALLTGHPVIVVASYALLLGFSALSMGVVLQAFRTLSPRFPKNEPTLAFFGDIAALGRDEYIARVESLSHEEALAHVCAYNYDLSRICVEKFRHLHWAIRFFEGAFACWVALLVLLFIETIGG